MLRRISIPLVLVMALSLFASAALGARGGIKGKPPKTTTTTTTSTPTTTLPTTTTLAPTTTTLPPAGVLWSAGHETGDVSEWSMIAISGNAGYEVVSGFAHTGDKSLRLWIDGSGGVRMEVNAAGTESTNLPREAYYSVWYYFPQPVYQNGWFWNVFQWKRSYMLSSGLPSRHPTWVVNVDGRTDGTMRFLLESKTSDDAKYMPNGVQKALSPILLPVGQWVQLECFYRWSLTADGRVACWQDGVPIWDVSGVTDMDYDFTAGDAQWPWFGTWQWTVNNYASATTPSAHSIWVDDAIVRVAP